jgi:hypothetical protein
LGYGVVAAVIVRRRLGR